LKTKGRTFNLKLSQREFQRLYSRIKHNFGKQGGIFLTLLKPGSTLNFHNRKEFFKHRKKLGSLRLVELTKHYLPIIRG